MFFICRPCYRGQAYCSETCRQKNRRIQRRKANQRYECDEGVRLDHRNRQRDYRQRLRECRVTDQSSAAADGSCRMRPPQRACDSEARAVEELHEEPKNVWNRIAGIVCRYCGRVGKFIAARIRRE